MAIRTINHPSVQINEIPKSLSAPRLVGNAVLATGFASQGLAKKPYRILSTEDFKAIFGRPLNEAERYFYHTCREVINNNGQLIAIRIPYDNEMDKNYKATGLEIKNSNEISTFTGDFGGFNVEEEIHDVDTTSDTITILGHNHGMEDGDSVTISSSTGNDGEYTISDITETTVNIDDVDVNVTVISVTESVEDSTVDGDITFTRYLLNDTNISQETYLANYAQVDIEHNLGLMDNIYTAARSNNYFSAGDIDNATITPDFIVVDKEKTKTKGFTQDKDKEGLFVTVTNIFHALINDQVIESADNYYNDQITGLYGYDYSKDPIRVDWYDENPNDFVDMYSAKPNNHSVSRTLANQFPTLTFDDDGLLTKEYHNYIVVHVCETVQDVNDEGRVHTRVLESHIGSLNPDAKDEGTGRNTYIADIVNGNSAYIEMYAEENYNYDYSDDTGFISEQDQPELIGFNQNESEKIIDDGVIVSSLTDIFSKEEIANTQNNQIDIVVDGGVSSIAQYITIDGAGKYEPEKTGAKTITSKNDVGTWIAVSNKYIDLCQNIRKDCMAIVDGPRHLVLDAEQPKMIEPLGEQSFSTIIGRKLRYLSPVRSTYVAVYINWLQVFDATEGINFWLPQSSKVVGNYLRNDQVANVWSAPAGVPRGVMGGVIRLSFNPWGQQEDMIYEKALNYAKFYPDDGFVIEGQKTAQVKPSPVDRVQTRRTLLRLQKYTKNVLHYYRYEQNTAPTRRRVINALDPKFREYENGDGLYEYEIKCDRENNTDDVLDANELKVDIAVKVTKTAEFIIVNFYPVDVGIDFDEVL